MAPAIVIQACLPVAVWRSIWISDAGRQEATLSPRSICVSLPIGASPQIESRPARVSEYRGEAEDRHKKIVANREEQFPLTIDLGSRVERDGIQVGILVHLVLAHTINRTA